ncbi:MAG TPA: STAS domain-containing protein [Terriglobia bacterium]|nr:STAS domain-containing protein [Terriglobia bacterium]
MSFSLKTRKVDNVTVIDLFGNLSIGEPVALFKKAIQDEVDRGESYFVINLGQVSHVDSSGLGQLIATYVSIRKQEGNVVLLNLTARIKDLLQMTKLLTVFESFSDEAKALEAAGKPGQRK